MGNAADEAKAATSGATGSAGGAGKRILPYQVPTQVFMGYTSNYAEDVDQHAHDRWAPVKSRTADYAPTIEAAQLAFFQMSDDARNAIALNLYKAGIIKDPTDMDALQEQWNRAVNQAAAFLAAGKPVTPWEVLNMKLGLAKSGNSGVGSGTSRVDTSYNIPSKQDAEASIKAVFKDAVGRNPTESELTKYTSMMVGLGKQNPSVTTSASDARGNVVSSSTGGINTAGMQQAVQDDLQHSKEYGAYQAATTYYNALAQAIASPV